MSIIDSSLPSSSSGSSTDELVKVSSNDTNARYLEEKIVSANNRISISTLNEGSDEDLQLSLNESNIVHQNLSGSGTNDHAQIDTHISDSTIHFTQSSIDHGSISGLADDDHTQYHNDSRALSWLGTRSTSDLPEGSNLYYTEERSQDSVGSILVDSSEIDLIYSDATPSITADLKTTTVTPGTYGDSDTVAIFTVDSKGRLTSASNSDIFLTSSRITDFDLGINDRIASLIQDGSGITWVYDRAISPLDSTLTPTINLSPFTTTDLAEGSNLYFTDERAQDAIGLMVDSSLVYTDGGPTLSRAALVGDVTASQGSNSTTLATVNSNVGTFGSATQSSVVTVNAKGLVTSASQSTITPAVGSITGLATGIATWLATPSSANLASAMTDETGSGAIVFANTPTLVTPVLGAATGTSLVLSGSLTSNALTSGRVVFAGSSGILQDDADMTFSGDTLTVTKLVVNGDTSVAGVLTVANGATATAVQVGDDTGTYSALQFNGANNTARDFIFQTAASPRFTIRVSGNETGSNAGANLNFLSFNDSGVGLSTVLQLRRANGNIGFNSTGFGTSAVAVLSVGAGTAPTTSPADTTQLWTQDTVAGQNNLYSRNENGKSEQLTGLRDRVSSQFNKTNNTLADITGLSINVEAGKAYGFRAVLFTSSNSSGGVKSAISGTATATSIHYEGFTYSGGTITQTRSTALAGAVGGVTAVTAATIIIEGHIVVNAAGTLTVQFAQNATFATQSSVLIDSYFQVFPIGD